MSMQERQGEEARCAGGAAGGGGTSDAPDTAGAKSVVQQHQRRILAHATICSATHAQMVRSPENVRKKPRDLRELLGLVRTQGLLQNLICYEQEIDGQPTGRKVVVAGDGRWQVIGTLIAEGSLPEDYQIPYLRVTEAEAVLVSLAENLGHKELHPADVFEGMRTLAERGSSVEDIGLIFSLPALTVRRRLKLANVAPALFALYRDDRASYEQMAALAVSDDHAAQQAAWDGLPQWERQPARLRRLLLQHSVPARGDRLAHYVGLKAYQAAGGTVTRDLFSEQDEGFLDDPALLETLAAAKLERVARRLARESWSWIAVLPRIDAATLASYGRVRTAEQPPSTAQAAQLRQLEAEAAALLGGGNDGGDDEARDKALAANRAAQGRIRATLLKPDPADMALAGALVTVDENGQACVLRGLVRPQDKGRMARHAAQAAVKARPEHSARLTERLAAQCTLGLRVELVQQPEVALRVLAHRLLSVAFYEEVAGAGALQLALRTPDVPAAVRCGAAWERWQAQRAVLAAQLPPRGGAALMAWLQGQPRGQVDACIAYCLSCGVGGGGCDSSVASLAQAVGLDMHAWWQPSAENYFSHVSKGRMMAVVTQAVSPVAAAPLAAMPHMAAAEAAARALAGSGWLPDALCFAAKEGAD